MRRVIQCIFSATLLVIVGHSTCYGQQYPVFTQYYFNELVINPAYAGSHIQLSATMMYRNQWVNFDGAPRTFSTSAHTSLVKNKIGVGMLINHDEIGSYANEHIYGYYSYMLNYPQATLSMGIQAGFNLLGADYSQLDLQHDFDPSFANIFNEIKPNFGVGLYYHRKNFFAGFSIPFILNNRIANVQTILDQIVEARYYFIRSGAIINLDRIDRFKANPSVLVRAQEGQPLNVDLNLALLIEDVLSVGVSYRNIEGIITFLDLKLSERFHFGYSYDWTSSQINQVSNGTHEFMLNYRVPIRSIHGNAECPSYYQYK